MTILASPELVAQNALPKGVERIAVMDRASWLSLRERDVTASVAGAILDVHEYESRFGLWALKSGKVKPDTEQTAAMERGELLEPVTVELLRRRHPDWQILYPVSAYYRDPAARLGCTPDVFVVDPARPGFGNYQCKSVEGSIFRSKWKQADGTVEPPLWQAIQSSCEASLTGASWAMVGALVVGFGLDLHEVEVPIHAGIMAKLREESLDFWRRVEEDDPPPANFERDEETLKALYADADEGLTIDLSRDNRIGEIVAEHDALKAREGDGTAAAKARKILDAEILSKLGNAARAKLADGRVIEAKKTVRKGYVVEPTSFRTVKIKEAVQ